MGKARRRKYEKMEESGVQSRVNEQKRAKDEMWDPNQEWMELQGNLTS